MNYLKTTLTVLLIAVLGYFGYGKVMTPTPAPEPKEEENNIVKDTPLQENNTDTTVTNQNNSQPKTKPETAQKYKDGNYTVNGSYQSPGGSDTFVVNFTISKDVITDSSFKSGATNKTSNTYQSGFASAYKQVVVGKKIDEVKLNVVSGASLTSGAFNRAIEGLKVQAKI